MSNLSPSALRSVYTVAQKTRLEEKIHGFTIVDLVKVLDDYQIVGDFMDVQGIYSPMIRWQVDGVGALLI